MVRPLALLLIDLDHFKEINGHLADTTYGDIALQQLHPRLQGVLQTTDTIAQIGRGELAVLLPRHRRGRGGAGRKEYPGAGPSDRSGQAQLDISGSIGIALFPGRGRDPVTLVQRADVAMYAAKRTRLGLAVYSADQSHYSPHRLALITDLRQAIKGGQLLLHYQPKVDLRTMHPCGAGSPASVGHTRGTA